MLLSAAILPIDDMVKALRYPLYDAAAARVIPKAGHHSKISLGDAIIKLVDGGAIDRGRCSIRSLGPGLIRGPSWGSTIRRSAPGRKMSPGSLPLCLALCQGVAAGPGAPFKSEVPAHQIFLLALPMSVASFEGQISVRSSIVLRRGPTVRSLSSGSCGHDLSSGRIPSGAGGDPDKILCVNWTTQIISFLIATDLGNQLYTDYFFVEAFIDGVGSGGDGSDESDEAPMEQAPTAM